MDDKQPQTRVWYLRRDGRCTGPFSSAAVRRLLLQDQMTLDDQVSLDRQVWTLVREVPEVVPPQLRGAGDRAGDGIAKSQQLPWLSILLFSLIVAGTIGFGFWWGGSDTQGEADCRAEPAPGVDWRNCRLRGVRAAGANLMSALAQNADLSAASFAGADLSDSQLDYADLSRADLAYANLRRVSLRGANLSNADLTNADLSAADLSFADLTGAVISGAVLNRTRFDQSLWLDGRSCRTGSYDGCIPAN